MSLTERSQSGKVPYLRVPTTYDIWEKANHRKGGLLGVCGGVKGWGMINRSSTEDFQGSETIHCDTFMARYICQNP